MKVVIDIDKRIYEHAKLREIEGSGSVYSQIIANGTPLPRHHGDLIDRNVIYAEFDKAKLSKKEMIGKLIVFGVPAVIPADEEDNNGQS